MSNKNKNKNNKGAPSPARPQPVAAPPPPPVEPTPGQIERIEGADAQITALTIEHGPPAPDAPPEPRGPTLEACLLRVESQLRDARAHFERARARSASVESDERLLAERRAAQDEAIKQARRAADEAIKLDRRAADEAIATGKKQLAADEAELLGRLTACEAEEHAVTVRKGELDAREADLAARAATLTAQALDAERGFLAEKIRVLAPVQDEAVRLRDERDRLAREIDERRAEADRAAQARAHERSEQWRQEDARRLERDAAARRALDDELAAARKAELARLRGELQAERSRAEAEQQKQLDARRAAFEADVAALEARARELAERQRQHTRDTHDLETEQGLLADDRAALEKKVARLVAERTEAMRHDAAACERQLTEARAQRDKYAVELDARRELDRRFGDRTPEQILAGLVACERERDELARQLRERPGFADGERLVVLERERSSWLEERALLLADIATARGELATRRLAAIELESLRKQKEALEIHKHLLDRAIEELRTQVRDLTRQENLQDQMPALTSLDDDEELQVEARTITPLRSATPNLEEFADDLRHRIARGVPERTLYYAGRDVRAFLGGLAMTRLLLLQGISGTGKTSLPLAFAAAVGGDSEVVEVQAGWRDRQDLIGYYNAFHRHYYATDFLKALYRAGTPAGRDRLFMMVLDEINLSRPEQFFADFLSALEQHPLEKRRLTLVTDPVSNAPRLLVDGCHLPIPPNVWFVGTANHDETTSEFADKTYDRAHVMEMPRKTEAAQFPVQDRGVRGPISYKQLLTAFGEARVKHERDVHAATEWLRKASFARMVEEKFRVGWGNRLEHQLADYLPVVVAAGGTPGEAMDHLLATKILRKLKDRHDVRVDALEHLRDQLFADWAALDQTPPDRCIELLEREIAGKRVETNE